MKKNILVTGGAGFLGSFLCEKLILEGHFVLCIDNLFRGSLDNLKSISSKNFLFEHIDLSQVETTPLIHDLIQKHQIETVYHLAAVNGTQYFYDAPFFVLDQNIKITQVLLEGIKGTSVKKIIYTSSSEVYGDALVIPTPEETPILLHSEYDRDSYAASKAIGEFYVIEFCKKYGLESLILRVFNLYGPRMINTRYGQVIPEFIQRIITQQTFTLIGDGNQTRSFCYIQDAIVMINMLLNMNVVGILNLGHDEEIKILDLAQIIHQLMQRNFKPSFLPKRAHDHEHRRPKLDCLKKITGPFSYTPLQAGLRQTIDFYQKITQQ